MSPKLRALSVFRSPKGLATEPKGACNQPRSKTTRSISLLILTRRIGETLKIGEDIDVTVLGVQGNQVRIGIKAPKDVAVHREEVFDRIQRELKDKKPDGPNRPEEEAGQ